MAQFRSYSRLVDVQRQLEVDYGLEVHRAEENVADDPRPRFAVESIVVPQYSHLGYTGCLTLTFYNDRLADLRFATVDYDAYLDALARTGMVLGPSGRTTLEPHTTIWAATHYDGERYVGWQDARLYDEYADWIARYS